MQTSLPLSWTMFNFALRYALRATTIFTRLPEASSVLCCNAVALRTLLLCTIIVEPDRKLANKAIDRLGMEAHTHIDSGYLPLATDVGLLLPRAILSLLHPVIIPLFRLNRMWYRFGVRWAVSNSNTPPSIGDCFIGFNFPAKHEAGIENPFIRFGHRGEKNTERDKKPILRVSCRIKRF